LAQDTGTISGAFALENTGDGTLIISGLADNTFTGDTHVSAGTLALGKTSGITAVPGTLTIDGPGTVKLLASNQIEDTSVVTFRATAGTATFDTNGRAKLSHSSPVSARSPAAGC
jgi:fibronectin-binding autotransporter adhesin